MTRAPEIREHYLDEAARHYGHNDYASVTDTSERKQLADLVDRLLRVLVDEDGIADIMEVTSESARVYRARQKAAFPEVAQTGKFWFRDEVIQHLHDRGERRGPGRPGRFNPN